MRVITFYSYKGGVGRTTMLANIAVRLASKGKRVGCIDFDIESAGLNSIFDNGDEDDFEFTTQDLILSDDKDELKHDLMNNYIKLPIDDDSNFIYFIPASHSHTETTQATMRMMNDFEGVIAAQKVAMEILKKNINLDYLFIDSRAGISQMAVPPLIYANDIVVLYRLGIQQQVGMLALLDYLIYFYNDTKSSKKEIHINNVHFMGCNIKQTSRSERAIEQFTNWLNNRVNNNTKKIFKLVQHTPFWQYKFFNNYGSRVLDEDIPNDQYFIQLIDEISSKIIKQ